MSTGVTSLRPGATTGWTDADGVWCGEGYRIRIHYGSDTPTYACKGSGVGNAAGNATLVKISGCLVTCVRKVEAYRG